MAQALADVCGRPPTEAALRKSHEDRKRPLTPILASTGGLGGQVGGDGGLADPAFGGGYG